MERFGHDFIQAIKHHPSLSVQTICYRGSRAWSPLFSLLVIPRALWLSRRADVVHLGDPMLSLAGWLIKTIWRKPIAVTIHGLDITYPHPLYQTYLRLFFRSFDYYFPISAAVAAKLQPFRVSGQVKIINPPLSVDYYYPSIKRKELNDLLSRYEINPTALPAAPSPVYLLTTGRLVARKGQAWFISQVMPLLPAHVYYLVAGTGPAESTLRQQIREQHLERRVHLLGRIADSDLRILYNTVDAYVQPNIHVANDIEGFGLVVIEAAACQLPVFAAAVDGIPDAIISGQNGVLLPASNASAWQVALQSSIAHPTKFPLARAFTLQHYTWSAYLQQWLGTVNVGLDVSTNATTHASY